MTLICPGCNKVMFDGQPMNGLLRCHWDCQDVVREQMGQQNADDLIQFRVNARLKKEGIDEHNPLFGNLGGKVA